MGHGFGHLYKIRNIVYYRLSPFEQRAFAGFSHGIPNMLRRIREEIFYVAPPLILGYLLYTEGKSMHAKSMRKNPADFENDQ